MEKSTLKAILSQGLTIDVKDDNELRVLEQTGNSYVAEYNNKIYNISVESFDPNTKSYTLTVNDVPVQLGLKNELDQLIDKLGLKSQKEENVSQILAPMPGLVVDISVSVGDEVNKGDALLVLEAMKMENVLKSKGSGIVKSIQVSQKDKVDKGQLLIEFE
jgi:biotin carboxyl carrier protein